VRRGESLAQRLLCDRARVHLRRLGGEQHAQLGIDRVLVLSVGVELPRKRDVALAYRCRTLDQRDDAEHDRDHQRNRDCSHCPLAPRRRLSTREQVLALELGRLRLLVAGPDEPGLGAGQLGAPHELAVVTAARLPAPGRDAKPRVGSHVIEVCLERADQDLDPRVEVVAVAPEDPVECGCGFGHRGSGRITVDHGDDPLVLCCAACSSSRVQISDDTLSGEIT
jgi:hypothetical protein